MHQLIGQVVLTRVVWPAPSNQLLCAAVCVCQVEEWEELRAQGLWYGKY